MKKKYNILIRELLINHMSILIRSPASWKVEMGPCNGWVYQYHNNQTKKNEPFFTKALFQVRSLVRNVRSAEPGKKDEKKGKKGKKGKGKRTQKGKGKTNANKKKRTGKGDKKGKGKGGKKRKGKEGNGKKGNKGRNAQKKGRNGKKNGNSSKKEGEKEKKNGKNSKGKDSNKKKGRSGKDSKLLPEFLYNQLWCFDLAMEQVLKSFDNNLVVFMPAVWQNISDVFLIVENVCRLSRGVWRTNCNRKSS